MINPIGATQAYGIGSNDKKNDGIFNSDAYKNMDDSYKNMFQEMERAAEAMKKSAEEAPAAAKKTTLSSLVKHVEMLYAQWFTKNSWGSLMQAYAKAKAISLSDGPSMKQLNKAIDELTSALAALESAQTEPEEDAQRDALPLVMKLQQPTQNTDTSNSAVISSNSVDLSV